MKNMLLISAVIFIGYNGAMADSESYYSGHHYIDYVLDVSVNLYNDASVELVDGGRVQYFWARDNSSITMSGGFVSRDVRAYDDVDVTMSGGMISGSLYGYQISNIDMTGGSVIGLLLSGYDAQIDRSGGTVGEAMRVLNNGRIDLWGTAFTVYSSDYPNGAQLPDGDNLLDYAVLRRYPNGYYYHSCQIEGTLEDGTNIDNIVQINNVDPWEGSANIYVHIVPEPVSISISGSDSVNEYDTANYTCTATYADASTADITSKTAWNISEPDWATINANGLFTALEVFTGQTVTINAQYLGVTDDEQVAIEPVIPDVTGLLLSQADLVLNENALETGNITITHIGEVAKNAVVSQNPVVGTLIEAIETVDFVIYLGQECLGYFQSDINGDCMVNLLDFAILAEEWLGDATIEE